MKSREDFLLVSIDGLSKVKNEINISLNKLNAPINVNPVGGGGGGVRARGGDLTNFKTF